MKKLINIFLSIILISFFIWFKFIRERIPQEIPVKLHLLSFFFITVLLFISLFKIFQLLKIKKQTLFFEKFYYYLCYFDNTVKRNIFQEKYIDYFFEKTYSVSTKCIPWFIKIEVIIRFIFAFIFLIDVFFFHKLFFIYKVVFLYLFTYIFKYYIFSIRNFIITKQQELVQDINILRNFSTEQLSIKDYIEINTNQKLKNQELLEGSILLTYDFIKKKHLELKLTQKQKINSSFFTKQIRNMLSMLINLNLIISIYDSFKGSTLSKVIQLMINIFYLLCWIYILLVSFHTLNFEHLFKVLHSTWKFIEDPFAQIIEHKIDEYENNIK